MKIHWLKPAALILCATLSAQAASAATYVGSYRVDQGPNWRTNPTVYSATEAAALLFGGSASDYDISTVGADPLQINHLGWYTIWGISGGTTFNEDYKLDLGAPGYNDPQGSNSAISAYTGDNAVGAQFTNFVFLASAPAVPEPATWALMLMGFGLVGAALRRRTAVTVSYV